MDIRKILALMAFGESVIVLLLLFIVPIPEENRDTLNMAIGGIVVSNVAAIVGYYFVDNYKKDPSNNEHKSMPPL